MHRNPALEMHPVEFTNDPYHRRPATTNLIAINATHAGGPAGPVRLREPGLLHAVLRHRRPEPTSCAPPTARKDGKAFIVVPSTAKDDTISRIVPTLTPGTHMSTSKNDINYVVSEFGVAQLRGKSAKQRALELINIAHPNFREELRAAARKINLL